MSKKNEKIQVNKKKNIGIMIESLIVNYMKKVLNDYFKKKA